MKHKQLIELLNSNLSKEDLDKVISTIPEEVQTCTKRYGFGFFVYSFSFQK